MVNNNNGHRARKDNNSMEQYRLIEDPGHGWLEVPTLELVSLGISEKISAFSYQSVDRELSYLEEDCDLGTFAIAKGWSQATAYKNWRTEYQENTFIRGLKSYSPVTATRPEGRTTAQ